MKHEIKLMLRNSGGAIVNNSSVGGNVGLQEASIYTATKHAVEGLTKTVALEFATRGIRVNAVAPAAIETDMLDRVVGREGERRSGCAHSIPSAGSAPVMRLQQPFFISLPTPQNSQPVQR